jgi:hypothetical protein
MAETVRSWKDIAPKDAVALDLSRDLSIDAPLNEMGERCPWPWEPQQLVGAPLGQFHCQYCGAMCVAGVPHLDYRSEPESNAAAPSPVSAATEATGGATEAQEG